MRRVPHCCRYSACAFRRNENNSNGYLPTWGVGLKPHRHEASRSFDLLESSSSIYHTNHRLRACFPGHRTTASAVLSEVTHCRCWLSLRQRNGDSTSLGDVLHIESPSLVLVSSQSVHYRIEASIMSTSWIEKNYFFPQQHFSCYCLPVFAIY